MSTENLSYVEGLLLSVLADDNNQRKSAEKNLYNLLSTSADEFFFCVIKLLRTSSTPNVRPLCAVFLRRFLPNGDPLQFDRLHSDLRILIKNELLAALTEEPHRYTRSQVADTISEMGRFLMGREENDESGWPQLLPFVLSSLTQSSPPPCTLCSLHILSDLSETPELIAPHLPTLHPLFAALFNHPNVEVKCECCFTYLRLHEHMESKKMDRWKSFQPLIISTINEAIAQQETVLAQKVLMQLYEALISEPKWIDSKVKAFTALFESIIHNDSLPDSLRLYAIEFFPTMAECSPATLRKHRDVMEKALECCFTMMMWMEEVDLSEWSVKREQDEEDDAFLDGGSSALGRFSIIGSRICPLVQPLIQNGLSHADWRYRFCALKAMAMVAKAFEPEDIPFPILLKSFEDPHPLCRYMATEAIGSIALDFTPFVQQTYGKDIVPPMAILLESSKDFPRIQKHAASALAIFIDEIDPEEISQYVDPLVKMTLNLLPNSHYIVQEELIALLGSLSTSPSFLPYYDDVVPMVQSVVFGAALKEQRLLRSRAMEALTFIGTNVDKRKFYPIAVQLKDLFAEMLKEKYEADDITEEYVLLSCMRLSLSLGRELLPLIPTVVEKCIAPLEGKWRDVREMLKKNSQHHDLEDPREQERLERLLHTNGNGHLHDDGDNDDDDQPDEKEKEEDPLESFRTTVMGGNDTNAIYSKSPAEMYIASRDLDDELDSIEERCTIIVGLCQNLEGAFAPFLSKVLQPLLEAARSAPYPTIRSCGITMHSQALLAAAANIREEEIMKRPGGMEAFLREKRYKKKDEAQFSINALFTGREDEPYLIHNEALCSMYRTLLSSWKQCFDREDQPDILCEMVGKCRLFFSVSYCLNRHIIDPNELLSVVEMFAIVLDKCLERIVDNMKLIVEEGEEDEETKAEVDEDNDDEQAMASSLTDTLGELMKCFGEGFMPAFDEIMAKRIGKWVEKSDFLAAQRVVMYVMIEVVSHCGRSSWHWIPRMYPHILEHCQSEESVLRQAASYFLGIIATTLPPQEFSRISDETIGILKSLIEHKDAFAEGNMEATDNAVVALSKIALHHGHAHSDLWDYWLSSLPLSADIHEGDFTYSLLADQVMANNPFVMGKDGANIPRIVSLLCGALDTPFLTGAEECAKVVNVLRTLFNQMPKEAIDQLLQSVTPEERKQIIETMEEIAKHEK